MRISNATNGRTDTSFTRGKAARRVRGAKEKREATAAFAAVALILTVSVAFVLRQAGRAQTVEVRMLDCPVTGSVAHHHDASCYDADGSLVCTLPEQDLHVHGDSCYEETRTLSCGLDETPAHAHGEACFDEEGNLVCGLDETEGHQHTDACYDVTRTLVCDQAEITEEHVHGPGCFRTETVSVPDESQPEPAPADDGATDESSEASDNQADVAKDARPAQTFEHSFVDADHRELLHVRVDAPEGALPEGSTMQATWVDEDALDIQLLKEVLAQKSDEDALDWQAADLTFRDAEGSLVEPAKKLTIVLTSSLIAAADDPSVVHVESEKEAIARAAATGEAEATVKAQVIGQLGERALKERKLTVRDDQLAFEADAAGVYGVACTASMDDESAEDQPNVLTAQGEDYTITVTYSDEAGIPAGTELQVREIAPGTDEYLQYLGRVWTEANKDYHKVEAMREHYDETMGVLPDVPFVNINAARFFDITLLCDGEKIEPQASVQVDISYDQGLYTSDVAKTGVVHYVDDRKIDLIEDVRTTVSEGEATDFSYEQESFSVVGTYVSQELHDQMAEPMEAPAIDPNGSPAARDVQLTDEALEQIISTSQAPSGLLRATETESPDTSDTSGLEKPLGSKTLTPNTADGVDDGTYTLTLSVKGHSSISTETEVKKSNILFVMDRSSSMITKTVNDELTRWYYGTKNTSSWRNDIDAGHGYRFYGEVDGHEVELNVQPSWGDATITYQSGTDWRGRPIYSNYPDDAPLYVVSKKTRMTAEQEALANLYNQLMAKNEASGANDDVIEISVISFGDQSFDQKSWSNETEAGWTKGRDTSPLTRVTNSNRFTSGTNWQEALQYAYSTISAKKAQDGADEDYYVIFLTDGEPTAVAGESGSAHHTGASGNNYAYQAAKDEAKQLVDSGIKFYNIFTYRKDESETYSKYLTNYAYGNGNNNAADTEAVQKYFTDAQTPDSLVHAFDKIFNTIEDSIGHGNVSITDTLTTDAMTTTVVQGKTNGYVYQVTDGSGAVLYTVTATGDLDNPTVTFNVPASATKDYVAQPSTVGGKTVYTVTTVEGKTYKMALADVNDTTGNLVWDLAPVGVLLNDCTYSVSFIVWPDQDAYDYVSALNNGLSSVTNSQGQTVAVVWDEATATDSGKGYKTGGVAAYPSIVKYPNGTFAVLTNTDQKVHYSVIETKTDDSGTNTTVNGPYYQDLQTPDPMPLTASSSQIEKVWNVERDPSVLAQLLYNPDGTSREYAIEFEILQGAEKAHYTDVSLGWDAAAGKYVWDEDSEQTVSYNGHDCVVGTHWASDFSIATGLMLSTARMEALGLDKSAYPSAQYHDVTYYILEEGHDYTIKEPGLSYEFDFTAPVYHPMLVDGVLQSVTLAKDGGAYVISDMGQISLDEQGVSSLVIQNTLRGYIHLSKRVVDKDGVQLPQDDTKFEFTVTLSNDEPVFKGDSIPWYGINGLFYHDDDFNYYQAERAAAAGHLSLRDEDGNVYDATCAGVFNPDIIGPTEVTFTDGTGTTHTIQLYGNQLQPSDGSAAEGYRTATAQLKINQTETLNIANVPLNTRYSITESAQQGYELVGVTKKVGDGAEETLGGDVAEGSIVANTDTNITYLNKSEIVDIALQKLDEKEEGLAGAVFQLKTVSADGMEEALATETEGIGGLGTVTRQENGEEKRYESALESTGAVQVITHLPDGTYRLYEACAPAGYIRTYGYVQFTIEDRVLKNVTTDTGDTSKLHVEPASGTGAQATLALLQIENEPGTALPNSGGRGVGMLWLAGSVLLAVGVASLLAKRVLATA